jgi:protein tyrosine/serine phosphatase
MIRKVVPNIWRASEIEVFEALKRNRLEEKTTIICLRRKLPEWWQKLSSKYNTQQLFFHYPIPPSSNINCSQKISDFIDLLVNGIKLPALIFCKEGRHRTGIISAIIRYKFSASVDDAINEYLSETNKQFREEEITIINKLCEEIKKDEKGKGRGGQTFIFQLTS